MDFKPSADNGTDGKDAVARSVNYITVVGYETALSMNGLTPEQTVPNKDLAGSQMFVDRAKDIRTDLLRAERFVADAQSNSAGVSQAIRMLENVSTGFNAVDSVRASKATAEVVVTEALPINFMHTAVNGVYRISSPQEQTQFRAFEIEFQARISNRRDGLQRISLFRPGTGATAVVNGERNSAVVEISTPGSVADVFDTNAA